MKSTGSYIIKLDTTDIQEKVSNGLDKAIDTTKETIQDISTKAIEEKTKETIKQMQQTTTQAIDKATK